MNPIINLFGRVTLGVVEAAANRQQMTPQKSTTINIKRGGKGCTPCAANAAVEKAKKRVQSGKL